MSLTQALFNAASGLAVASRASATVATNVANSMNETYARREIEIAGKVVGGSGSGAWTVANVRIIDQALLAERRAAQGLTAEAETRSAFLLRIEKAIGTPDEAGSLSARVAEMEAALVSAASLPQSESRLQAVLEAASGIAGQINAISDQIQSARKTADEAIARDVATLNELLARVADLNKLIVTQSGAGRDINDLLDQRQALIDGIAEIVPIREYQREDGRVALYTASGMELLESQPASFGFSATPVLDASMTIGAGLSGLTLNGKALVTSTDASAIAGGRLAGNFAVRDELGVAAQAQTDAIARNLIERFSDPATDVTLVAGEPGLFTDAGAAFDPASEIGLSARIAINSLVDPASGGALWRLRDGRGATVEGEQGAAGGLKLLSDALERSVFPASGGSSVAGGFSQTVANYLSAIATARQGAESETTFRTVRSDVLRQSELSAGVDTDQEMQKLLLIEEAYSANARVMQAVDAMLKQLLEI